MLFDDVSGILIVHSNGFAEYDFLVIISNGAKTNTECLAESVK
jgi:hypothetical protein